MIVIVAVIVDVTVDVIVDVDAFEIVLGIEFEDERSLPVLQEISSR